MDGNGARALARLLEERHGVVPPVRRRKRVTATEAAPIFHWFGVEPSTAEPKAPAPRPAR
jgi:hypothetical protein